MTRGAHLDWTVSGEDSEEYAATILEVLVTELMEHPLDEVVSSAFPDKDRLRGRGGTPNPYRGGT